MSALLEKDRTHVKNEPHRCCRCSSQQRPRRVGDPAPGFPTHSCRSLFSSCGIFAETSADSLNLVPLLDRRPMKTADPRCMAHVVSIQVLHCGKIFSTTCTTRLSTAGVCWDHHFRRGRDRSKRVILFASCLFEDGPS